jgi:phenylpropionate dioxygenase-like ring-hydroxylating dioxygenase large terminal subunit
VVPDWAPEECGPHWERDLGLNPVRSERYWSRPFHDLEIERVWGRTWQLACFEDDISNVGDSHVYDVGPLSFIIVRVAPGEIKAYYNSCLHRGTRLLETGGKVSRIRCPYHAWTWDLRGSLKHVPAEWDFPQLRKAEMCLPEARVGTWGGMVFLNPDPDAIDLHQYLSPIPEQCARYWPIERKARMAHVTKIFRANWKLTYAAFIETYHVITVHPQLGQRISTGNGRDAPYHSTFQFDHWAMTSRNAALEPSFGSMADAFPTGAPPDYVRQPLAERLGISPDRLSPEEQRGSSVIYHAFPNLQLGAVAFNYITRVRPHRDDPEMSVMDIYITRPLPEGEDKPAPPPCHVLGPDDPMVQAPEILMGGVDPVVYQQDVDVTYAQQRGIRSAPAGQARILFGQYMEACVRHHDLLIDEFVGRP